mgnify:CR=1 FL=1
MNKKIYILIALILAVIVIIFSSSKHPAVESGAIPANGLVDDNTTDMGDAAPEPPEDARDAMDDGEPADGQDHMDGNVVEEDGVPSGTEINGGAAPTTDTTPPPAAQ